MNQYYIIPYEMHNIEQGKQGKGVTSTLTKKCRLCGSEFSTTRDWQKFCCPEHQKEYWKKIQQDRYALNRKIEELEKKIERLSIQ